MTAQSFLIAKQAVINLAGDASLTSEERADYLEELLVFLGDQLDSLEELEDCLDMIQDDIDLEDQDGA